MASEQVIEGVRESLRSAVRDCLRVGLTVEEIEAVVAVTVSVLTARRNGRRRPLMPREVIEYRAVGVDSKGNRRETGWGVHRIDAENGLWRVAREDGESFLERRRVTYGEPERVKEGESDAV